MKNNPLNGYQPESENYDAREAHEATPAPVVNATPCYPTCRFCGKQTIPLAEYESQDAANEAATLQCDCAEARGYQIEVAAAKRREQNIKKLKKALDDIAPYFTKQRGVELTDKLRDLLFNCGVAVLDGNVGKANILVGRVKVAISINNKGAIIIALAYSDGARVEV